jgi:hypothetical protein
VGHRPDGYTSEYVVLSAIIGLRDFPEYLPVMDRILKSLKEGGEDQAHYVPVMDATIKAAEQKLSAKELAARRAA